MLFLQPLLEGFNQLVQAAEGLDFGPFLVTELAHEFAAQPFVGNQRLDMFLQVFQPFEVGGKGAVKLVVMTFVLDQQGTGQIVEFVHVGEYYIAFQRGNQVEQFAQRYRHAGGP